MIIQQKNVMQRKDGQHKCEIKFQKLYTSSNLCLPCALSGSSVASSAPFTEI